MGVERTLGVSVAGGGPAQGPRASLTKLRLLLLLLLFELERLSQPLVTHDLQREPEGRQLVESSSVTSQSPGVDSATESRLLRNSDSPACHHDRLVEQSVARRGNPARWIVGVFDRQRRPGGGREV